ncbi:MAG: hypothetical protein WBS18_02585 [Candidatus Acidiferrales bacterium]
MTTVQVHPATAWATSSHFSSTMKTPVHHGAGTHAAEDIVKAYESFGNAAK